MFLNDCVYLVWFENTSFVIERGYAIHILQISVAYERLFYFSGVFQSQTVFRGGKKVQHFPFTVVCESEYFFGDCF